MLKVILAVCVMASGIYAIVHIGQLKLYVCEATQLRINWPPILAQLDSGTHPNVALQQMWHTEGGKRNFTFHTRQDLESDREIIGIETFLEETASVTSQHQSQP